jgi:cation:H+ antiporter
VGALPLAFAISGGHLGAMQLDLRQREEIFLTSAQSLFALIVIADFSFGLWEAVLLFALFVPQFIFTHPQARLIEAGVYLVLSLVMVILRPQIRASLRNLLPGRRR